MKQLLTATLMLIILSVITKSAIAQEHAKETGNSCNWISDKGFWVIESNSKNNKSATIHFYNNDNIPVYSEKVEGKMINIKKRKTRMQLKQALETFLVAYEPNKNLKNDLVKKVLTDE